MENKVNIDYRDTFPVTQTHVYLNHAATAPVSKPLMQNVTQFMTDSIIGNQGEERWIEYTEKVRRLAAALIHVDADEIALVNNVSTGAMLIANGLAFNEGDEILVPKNQFPANVYPWTNLQQKGVRVITDELPHASHAVDVLESRMSDKTRLLCLSFVEYDDGYRHAVEKIGRLCRKNNVLFFVDAVQGLGALPLNARKAEIDFLATSGHKWLLGPSGQGFLYVRRERLQDLYVLSKGWLSYTLPFEFQNYRQPLKTTAGRFEGGTWNFLGIAGLGAALKLLHEVGIDRIENRIFQLSDLLRKELSERGFQIAGSSRRNERSGITAFRHESVPASDIFSRLLEQRIIVSERNDHIRVSPHFYNNEDDIKKLLAILPA